MVVRAQDVDAPQPPPQVVNRRNTPLLQDHHSFVSCYEPTKVEEALKYTDWINAMHEELNNFTRNEVWNLEERPNGARVIETKWVFRNKQDNQGVVVRNKARLVAKGFSQVEGLDFGDLCTGCKIRCHSYPTCICITS